MIPVLYDAASTSFTSLGLGSLIEAITCEVFQEVNGQYELTMQYPLHGEQFDQLEIGAIIKAKANLADDAQLFRIYRITKPLNGIITVYARHIVYDLSGIPVTSVSGTSLSRTISDLNDSFVVENPFEISAGYTRSGKFENRKPSAAFSIMGEIANAYEGEWKYDNFSATLVRTIGESKNAIIAYGKNLTTLEQDNNCANVYTGVYPFFKNGRSYVTPGVVYANGTYSTHRILPVDFTEAFESTPTSSELTAAAQSYIADNNIGVPEVSLSVQFVDIANTTDAIAGMESIALGDTITVVFEKLGVNARARVMSAAFDSLAERYNSVNVGQPKKDIADTINNQQAQINQKQNAVFEMAGGGYITRDLDETTEYINPPMVVGEEYRTIERYNDKPLYAKLVDFGNLPNETVKYIPHGVANIEDIAFVSGSAKNGSSVVYIPSATSNTYVNSSPYIVGLVWACGATETNVYIVTNANRTSWTGKIFMKYTKTTD